VRIPVSVPTTVDTGSGCFNSSIVTSLVSEPQRIQLPCKSKFALAELIISG